MFTFYILYSPSRDKFYAGYTGDDVEERLRRHNSNHKGFTGKAGDWKIVYTESFATKEAACAREQDVTKWKSRKRIEVLVNSSAGLEHPGL